MDPELVRCTFLLTLLTNSCKEANRVDADETAPIGAVSSGTTPFVQEASKTFRQGQNQTIFVVIGAFW